MRSSSSPQTFFQGVVRTREGAWRYGIPGGLSVFFAIVFGTGITDAGVRDLFAPWLATSLGLALLCVCLWWVLLRAAGRPFVVGSDRLGAFVRIEGVREVRAPLAYRFGWYSERVEAGVARATVAVLWVLIEGTGGPPLVVRKGLGAAFAAPDGWPSSTPSVAAPYALLTVESLPRALAAAGATTPQDLPGQRW